LARAYYIFLKDHFGLDDWSIVYNLLDLPEERRPLYEYFDARWYRAYVLAGDIQLTEEELVERLVEDGQKRLDELAGDNPNAGLLADYLRRQVSFSFAHEPPAGFTDYIQHYVTHQHKQCVYCSAVFETDRWMTADVREGITVQAFSNRLRGGPGDPKKYVCAVCKLQFLLEKLNYPDVRGENPVYFHLFPYSFLTAPFISGLQTTMRRILEQDVTTRALLPNTEQAFRAGNVAELRFAARTKDDRTYSYGLYLPRYSETVGNLLIFPFNPPGNNDSQRFLSALWNAMLLQRYFGCKVLLSEAPVATLDKESVADLFVDNVALSCRGLIARNDYAFYRGEEKREKGPLQDLWEQGSHLFAIKQAVFTTSTRRDEMLAMVQAMAGETLQIFYTAEKLLEARVRGANGAGSSDWLTIRLSQRIFPHVEALAKNKGGQRMSELSEHLKELAHIAWSNGLRGRTLAKNSLMTPLDEVFKKLNHRSEAADLETLRAAAADDIFEYLTRVTESQYRPGQNKWEACKSFVDTFFDDVYQGVYRGKRQKLLADEKLLRSAFLFYIREEIPRREAEAKAEEAAL
jgi:CRISPR-associated protein Csc3